MKLSVIGVVFSLALLLAAFPAAAQLEPAAQSGPRSNAELRASALTTSSIQAELAGTHQSALDLADAAIREDPSDAWGHYVRGSACLSLRRIDDALASLRDAERRSPASDPWGKSVAIWGQANVFEEAGRCQEATPIYGRYAAFVEHLDPTAAALAREYSKRQCGAATAAHSSALENEAASFEIAGNPQRSLEVADQVIRKDPSHGWGYYLRADALTSLHRVDEAVASFQEAERRFPASEAWEKSIAIWGQANALKEAGRCREAGPIYARYAALVQPRDPDGAAMGREYAQKQCVPLITRH